jgi:hypothetical protein
MFRKLSTSCLVLCLSVLLAGAQTSWGFNPNPEPDDFVLPMPGGESMAFRPVFIGEGGDPFALKKFKMGDPNGGFKENPTAVALGGAFLKENKGRKDWLYYLGKCEVTEVQYYAVMGGAGDKVASDRLKKNFPIADISWFDAMEFINRYNLWLFQNAWEKIPRHEESAGFLRLPSEVEWEFVARGGAMVSADEFDRKQPYQGNLAVFEWFSGPKSSHNRVREAGVLKPNILGIHDMLGNVSEMTSSIYQIEYYQGRYGGFVARGGHFLTAENQMRSSLRTEEPFYIVLPGQRPKPNRKATMGLRLLLSSVVFAGRETEQLMFSAWEKYRGSSGAILPAAVSVSPTSTQTKVKSEDAQVYMERLKKELLRMGKLSDAATREMSHLEASLADIQQVRRRAEEDSAYAWCKIAAERGFFISRETIKLPTLAELLQVAKKAGRDEMAQRYQERMTEVNESLNQALSNYSDSFRQLIMLNETAIEGSWQKYAQFLREHRAEDQVRILGIVKSHFNAFKKEQRADSDKWRKELSAALK